MQTAQTVGLFNRATGRWVRVTDHGVPERHRVLHEAEGARALEACRGLSGADSPAIGFEIHPFNGYVGLYNPATNRWLAVTYQGTANAPLEGQVFNHAAVVCHFVVRHNQDGTVGLTNPATGRWLRVTHEASVDSANMGPWQSAWDLERFELRPLPPLRIAQDVRGQANAAAHEADDAQYDVFVSHCKRLDASEDRAVWVADICEGAGLKVFFDRSDLTDISEEVLERSVKDSRVLVTVLDPHTFESDWVVKENQWAADAGRPIVPIYDGDRHRWDTIKKWCGSHPHVFAKQAINYNKDYRAESKQRLIDAVLRALARRAVERPPIAHAVRAPVAAAPTPPPAPLAEVVGVEDVTVKTARSARIKGTYDCVAWNTTVVITATADPNVVQCRGSRSNGGKSVVYEMVRSSTSPLVWNGVLPPQLFSGAPIRWEFEHDLNTFTSTAGGKPPTRYVKRFGDGRVGRGRRRDPFSGCVIS